MKDSVGEVMVDGDTTEIDKILGRARPGLEGLRYEGAFCH